VICCSDIGIRRYHGKVREHGIYPVRATCKNIQNNRDSNFFVEYRHFSPIIDVMNARWLMLMLCIPLTHGLPQLGITENSITSGNCKDVTFVYARGSTDYGNMVGVQKI
jgi:hypothetical protein